MTVIRVSMPPERGLLLTTLVTHAEIVIFAPLSTPFVLGLLPITRILYAVPVNAGIVALIVPELRLVRVPILVEEVKALLDS